jgi:hypothetical protein
MLADFARSVKKIDILLGFLQFWTDKVEFWSAVRNIFSILENYDYIST